MMHSDPKLQWAGIVMMFTLLAMAFALTGYLIMHKELDGAALGLVIGAWLREGLTTVFGLLGKLMGVGSPPDDKGEE